MGVEAGLKDLFHRPKEPVIRSADKAWVVHPGLHQAQRVRLRRRIVDAQSLGGACAPAESAGHPNLARAAKATVQRFLEEHQLQPHKVKYYLERRDPDFESKMKEVLMVYQVEVQNQAAAASPSAVTPAVITVSIDEKPGVQAIENTAPDLPPTPGKHPTVSRDHDRWKKFDPLGV